MFDQIRRQTEDIVRYYGEINHRVAGAGVDGVPKVLELATHLERALAEIGGQELEWVSGEIRRVLDELVRMESQVQRLRELKRTFDGATHEEPARRRSSL